MITGSFTLTKFGSLSTRFDTLIELTELLGNLSEELHYAVLCDDALDKEMFAHQSGVGFLTSYKLKNTHTYA